LLGWKWYDKIYYRYYVNTEYLPLPTLFFYILMQAIGFSFVRLINLKKPYPFARGNNYDDYSDVKRCLKYGVIVFFISSIIVLKHKYSMSSYCIKEEENWHFHEPEYHDPQEAEALLKESFPRLIASIDYMDYLGSSYNATCTVWTNS
jgi:hypothetical protein